MGRGGGELHVRCERNTLTAPAPYSLSAATYDYQNLPLSFTRSGTTTAYRYNEFGQRIAKAVGAGNTEVYLLEGRTPLGVFTVSGAGAVVSAYFNLLADTRVIGRLPSGGTRSYYHTDLLGSTRAAVQGATVTESFDYDPWGVLMPARSLGSGTKERFTTKERDAESQLDYFGARYYASAIGRWTSVDPAMAADSTPSWSPFAYVEDQPVSQRDPWGRQLCCRIELGARIAAVVQQDIARRESEIREQIVMSLYDLTVGDGMGRLASGALAAAMTPASRTGVRVAEDVVVEQYALIATEPGFRPVMRRGFTQPQGQVWMEAGEVWKFGTTKSPSTRYSPTYLADRGLLYRTQSTGTLQEALSAERTAIQKYLETQGRLPPGNKIIR